MSQRSCEVARDLGLCSVPFEDTHLALIVTAHPGVDHELIASRAPAVLDLCGVLPGVRASHVVMLYWSIGRDILDQQQAGGWGDDVVGRIAQDLSADTGSARGFSRRNLFYMRRFATLWPEREKVPSVMAQIAWTSHRVLMDRFREDPARAVGSEDGTASDIDLLIELGSGFAFYGRQRALLVGEQEYFVDLLFYHHTLRRIDLDGRGAPANPATGRGHRRGTRGSLRARRGTDKASGPRRAS